MSNRICPTCGSAIQPNRIGRPRVYCSTDCLREMTGLRRELPQLEAELDVARSKESSGFWPGSRFWSSEVRRLELAIDAARSRLPEGAHR